MVDVEEEKWNGSIKLFHLCFTYKKLRELVYF